MKLKNYSTIRTLMSSFFLLALLSFAATSISAQEKEDKTDSKLAKQAKISLEKAREIALTKEPNGKIESEELEKEHGKLVYSFDIRNEKGTITEVQVNAKTGAIVSVEEEDKQAEEKEKKEDMKEKGKKSKKPESK